MGRLLTAFGGGREGDRELDLLSHPCLVAGVPAGGAWRWGRWAAARAGGGGQLHVVSAPAGTLPCLPLHFRTRLRGAGGSPRVVGVRAGRDSARPGAGLPVPPVPSVPWDAFCKGFRFFFFFCDLRRATFDGGLWPIVLPLLPDLSCSVGVGEGSGGGKLGKIHGPFPPPPLRRAEIVLEASGTRRPALVPGCWGEGRLRGGAPSSRGPGRRTSGSDEGLPSGRRPPSWLCLVWSHAVVTCAGVAMELLP